VSTKFKVTVRKFINMSTKVDKSEQFSGKSDGITFEKLDEKVLSWGRKKFGDKYATLLWKDELTDLTKLDLKDELEMFEYNMHCTMVYDVLGYDSAKYADGLFETTRFWTLEYQLQTRQRFREKMFCYLETIVKGEAARQIKKQGVRRMAKMRKFLFERFGAGQPEILEERVRRYHLGMPDRKTGEAFPPRCDMEEKLDALEAEREYLVDMCPMELREGYEDGKETTLVRIILRHRPREYDSAVKTVMDLHRFRLYAKEGDLRRITNLEDNSRVVYNTDWLPNYDELRVALIAEYQLQKRRRDENNQSTRRSPGHPVLPVLQGFNQPGPQEKTCYGCGEKGHFKGDAECSAGPHEVWSGAPEGFKARMKGGGKGKSKGSSGKGRGRANTGKGNRQRNAKSQSNDSQVLEFGQRILQVWR
jgi:DNA-binding ferritin-like protein (Dps family)